MNSESDDIQRLIDPAKDIMSYLKFLFALLLLVTFLFSIIGFGLDFSKGLTIGSESLDVISVINTVMLIAILGSLVSVALSDFRYSSSKTHIIMVALAGVLVGVLEDWIGASRNIFISLAFALLILSLLSALILMINDRKKDHRIIQ